LGRQIIKITFGYVPQLWKYLKTIIIYGYKDIGKQKVENVLYKEYKYY
jgi:hypothetical protein